MRRFFYLLKYHLREFLFSHFEIYIIEKYYHGWHSIDRNLWQLRYTYIPISARSHKQQCATWLECYLYLKLLNRFFPKDVFRIVKHREEYKGSFSIFFPNKTK